MASIGELTATVRADISGFVGPMQQVARTTQQTTATVQQVVPLFPRLAMSAGQAAPKLTQLRGTLTNIASAAVGVQGPIGSLASKLLMFGVGGGIATAVVAGLVAIAAAFRIGSADAQKQADTVTALAAAYDEMTGRAHEARLAMARAAQAEANRNTSLGITRRSGPGGFPIPGIGQVRDMEAVAEANRAVLAAEKELEEFRARSKPAGASASEMAKALERQRAALRPILDINTQLNGLLTSQLNTIQKQLGEVRAQKVAVEELAAAQQAIRDAIQQKANENIKGDSSLKDAVQAQQGEAVEAMRGVSEAMARGFVDAFRDNQKNLAAGIASALIAAAKEALVQFLAAKVFGGVLGVLFGGGGGKGGVPVLKDVPVIGQLFSSPSAASGVGRGAPITVDLSTLPRPLSPIEYARDDMWRTIFVETARGAQANGVNLQPRF